MDFYCPKCTAIVGTNIEFSKVVEFDPLEHVDAFGEPSEVMPQKEVKLSFCPRCEMPFLFIEESTAVLGGPTFPAGITELYPENEGPISESIPLSVRKRYSDALKAYKCRLYEPSVIMTRKCLEGICKDQGVSERSLYKSVEKMREQGLIDSKLYEWFTLLRSLGNEAAHDMEASITEPDAKDGVDFLEAILNYLYVMSTKFEDFQARREKRKSNQSGDGNSE